MAKSVKIAAKRARKRYNLPVIGHIDGRSVEFLSILEAEAQTGINYNLIFENCIGKIRSAKSTHWEYVDGKHWIKYRAMYVRDVRKYTRHIGFNG